eukprot:gene12611-14801_t
MSSHTIKRVLISGSSGFVGKSLVRSLQATGNYDVYSMVRKTPVSSFEIEWDPENETIDTGALATVSPDIVVHLAGENISGLWTEDKKRRILDSRTKGTKLLADTCAMIDRPPPLFISASGCTYHGTNVTEPTDETGPKGSGFLSDVVEKWEAAAQSLQGKSRVVNLRIGIVLDPNGGFLSVVYYPFYFGLGGVLGSGQQCYWSHQLLIPKSRYKLSTY